MKEIDVKKWRQFKIADIFETEMVGKKLQVPTGSYIAKKDLIEGSIPRIAVSGFDNGVSGYYAENINVSDYRIFENFISVSFLGTVFYQKSKASLDMKVHCLKPKSIKLNQYIAWFLVSVIRKIITYSTYNDQLSSTVLPNLVITLPSKLNTKGEYEPDWQYMEDYIKDIEKKVQFSSVQFSLSSKTEKENIDCQKWKEFVFGELFQMQKQKEISPILAYNKNTQKEIKYPFYGQSSENNGIISYISLDDDCLLNNKENKPIIMIHSNNHLSFYINSPFYLKDGHGATSLFTNQNLNEYNVFFVISVLNKTMEDKFDYTLKATKEKLNSLRIKLPINKEGDPDWKYMEKFIAHTREKTKSKLNCIENLQ